MRHLACAIYLLLCPFATHAAANTPLNDVLNAYYNAPATRSRNDVSAFSQFPATREVIERIFSDAHRRLEHGPQTPALEERVESLLSVAAAMAPIAAIPPSARLSVNPKLAIDAGALLHVYFKNSQALTDLLAVYDFFGLWNRSDTWFFLNTNATNLNRHALRIQRLIPRLPSADAQALETHLRNMPGGGLTALCLIVDLHRHQPSDLVKLFQLASLQFSRAVIRGLNYDQPAGLRMETFEAHNLAIANTLLVLSRELAERNTVVVNAFDAAIAEAQQQKPTDYTLEHRLLFFEMLQEQSLDWYNRDHWMARAESGGASRAFMLRGRYQVNDGNVISVRFPGSKACAKRLEGPK